MGHPPNARIVEGIIRGLQRVIELEDPEKIA
jgi:hypothetical protein